MIQKRILIVAVIAFCSLIVIPHLCADGLDVAGREYPYRGDYIALSPGHIFAEPSPDSEIVATYGIGMIFQVVAKYDGTHLDWFKVETPGGYRWIIAPIVYDMAL